MPSAMSGPRDPIPDHEIRRHIQGPGTATDDAAGFVDGAKANRPPAVDPGSPITDILAPMPTPAREPDAVTRNRLDEFIRQYLLGGAKRLDDGEDAVDIVTSLLTDAVVIPGKLGGSVLPMVAYDGDRVHDITVVESVSGGADEVNQMPRRLTLCRRTLSGDRRATYIQK